MNQVYFISAVVSTFSPLLPLVIYWLTRKSQASQMRYLGIFLLLSILADIIGMANSYIRNEFLGATREPAYAVLSITMIVLFYRSLLPQKWRKFCIALLVVLLVAIVYSVYVWQNPERFNNFSSVLTAVTMIGFSLVYFFIMINELPATSISKIPMFWINTGLLIYSAGSLVFSVMKNIMLEESHFLLMATWIAHNLINIFQYVLIAIGLWQVAKHKPS